MEYYASIKLGIEIRRTLLSCNDTELAHFMQKLTELLIKSDQKNIMYKFIVNLSHTQNYDILQKMEQILPNQCKIQDSITKSMNITPMITKTNTKIIKPMITHKVNKQNKRNTHNNNVRSKRHRNRRKKKKHLVNSHHFLNSVSSDVLLSIFNYLSFYELLSLQKTCRYFLRECLHPKALYEIKYSFDNEHCINQHFKFNQLRFANIYKLSLSHEFGEFDREITNQHFNHLWFKNVRQLNCSFATEYVDCCNFNQFLQLKVFKFESIKILSINLSGQNGSNWLNLILNQVINTDCLQQLYLTHILESVDIMKMILNCRHLEVLSVKNLDFPTLKYFDSTEYEEMFEAETIVLQHIQTIVYIDDESCVGINEWMRFIGYLIENTRESKVDLSVSYRCLYNKYNNESYVLFENMMNTKNIIQKLNNLCIDIADGMVHSTIFLVEKLLEFDRNLDVLKISGMIVQNELDLDLLYEKFKVLFKRSNRAYISFSDYYHNDTLRMSLSNPVFLAWVQKLVHIAPNKVFVDFSSQR